jgi:hypothetical protein
MDIYRNGSWLHCKRLWCKECISNTCTSILQSGVHLPRPSPVRSTVPTVICSLSGLFIFQTSNFCNGRNMRFPVIILSVPRCDQRNTCSPSFVHYGLTIWVSYHWWFNIYSLRNIPFPACACCYRNSAVLILLKFSGTRYSTCAIFICALKCIYLILHSPRFCVTFFLFAFFPIQILFWISLS